MAFTAGTRLGAYEVLGLLGAGGMGEVYRARDPKLKRDVAIKALPDAFSRDAERLARFQREAEALASLNHPSIGAVYDFGESNGRKFLVLELVEGGTLADRIAQGPIPLDEVLPIARQIAEALEAAHERGITHRDLKPANIKLTPEGRVKVLDFGLAKMQEGQGGVSGLSNSPTMSAAATEQGVILGTAAYMSPEQARGKAVDKRTDIWAYGCVVSEMLTGQRLFQGDDISEVIASILRDTPDWKAIRAALPPEIAGLLRRCLEKDATRRLRDIGEARIAIEAFLSGANDTAFSTPASGGSLRKALPWALCAVTSLAALLLLIPAFNNSGKQSTPEPEMRLDITTPATSAPLHFAISPDGRNMAFVASGDGRQRLWIRSLGNTTLQPLAGTDGAEYPFWSPDSKLIGFFADSKLKRVAVTGGSPEVVVDASGGGRGGSWGPDGTILFAGGAATPLTRVSPSGKIMPPVTHLSQGQISHRLPIFLPDGRHFLFFAQGGTETQGIYWGSLEGESKQVLSSPTAAAWAPPNQLLFLRDGTLVARPFDIVKGEFTGEGVRVADSVASDSIFFISGVSASASGLVAYRSGGSGGQQLLWFDRKGNQVGKVGDEGGDSFIYPDLSRDGTKLAVSRTVQGNLDVWIYDLLKGGRRRFTTEPTYDTAPIFSPDGTQIVFRSNPETSTNIYLKKSDGTGAQESLLPSTTNRFPLDWSKDGKFALYWEISPKTDYDIWTVSMTGERKPTVFANTRFNETGGQFSPDGQWVAYQSNDSGRFEINVAPFPATGSTPLLVSRDGGSMPRWNATGKELFFVAPDSTLMSTTITAVGKTLEFTAPIPLFKSRVVGGIVKHQYAVSRDGRFLINTPTEADASPITLILNWKP